MRVSYKEASEFAKCYGLRVVRHTRCGKNDYYYHYSLVRGEEGQNKIERIMKGSSLKDIMAYLTDLFEQEYKMGKYKPEVIEE